MANSDPISTMDYVKSLVDKHMEWHSDKEVYDVPEKWVSHAREINRRATLNRQLFPKIKGDCDDYSLTYIELLMMYVPSDLLRIIVCNTEAGPHCVAGVDHQGKTYILDCNQPRVVEFGSLPYTWIKGMRYSEKGTWREIPK